MTRLARISLVALLLISTMSSSASAAPLGHAWTYQFTLLRLGAPYTGTCDLSVSLWDAPTGGIQIGTTNVFSETAIVDGLVTLALDFGA